MGLFSAVATSALGPRHVVAVVDPPHERHDLVFVDCGPSVREVIVGEGDCSGGGSAENAIAQFVRRPPQIRGRSGLEAAMDMGVDVGGRPGEAGQGGGAEQ